jgi:hypothetical protein
MALAIGLVTASAAFASFVAPDTGACATVGPPTGQTGGYYWDGSDGTCSADWISSDDFQSLVNRDVAAADEATGLSVPSDIPASDAQAGSSFWDSLPNVSGDTQSSAFDFLSGMGDWASFASFGSVTLGAFGAVGTFEVGWQIGSQIADWLGITQGPPAGGNWPIYKAVPEPAGWDPDPTSQTTDCPGFGGYSCTNAGWVAPSDGWLLETSWGAPSFSEYSPYNNAACIGSPQVPDNVPRGAELIELATGPSPCDYGPYSSTLTEYMEWMPATVEALPGPGQGWHGTVKRCVQCPTEQRRLHVLE